MTISIEYNRNYTRRFKKYIDASIKEEYNLQRTPSKKLKKKKKNEKKQRK